MLYFQVKASCWISRPIKVFEFIDDGLHYLYRVNSTDYIEPQKNLDEKFKEFERKKIEKQNEINEKTKKIQEFKKKTEPNGFLAWITSS